MKRMGRMPLPTTPPRTIHKAIADCTSERNRVVATRTGVVRKIQIQCLERVVASSAIHHVRLSWIGTVCWGTLLAPGARSFCCLIHETRDERRIAITAEIPAD